MYEPEIIAQGDKKVLDDLKRESDALLDQKFELMDTLATYLLCRHPVGSLVLIINKITARMVHIDARINTISHIPCIEEVSPEECGIRVCKEGIILIIETE